jgi:phosphotransferase system enzyme I (PtsI)
MKGVGVSPGISIGKAFIIKKTEAVRSGIELENDQAKNTEIEKFDKAVLSAIKEVEAIKGNENLTLTKEDIEFLRPRSNFLMTRK